MQNRIALVTGGIGDIGTIICTELTKRGARVVALDRADETVGKAWQLARKHEGFDIAYYCVDVTKFESCELIAVKIENEVGPIDILINAAGTIQDATLRNMTVEQWNTVVHTDLDSVFNITRQFINGMITRQYGRIISIASVSAEKGQFGQTNYASAKSGIYGFTKSLAQEVGKYGITVNAISPGFVKSRMVSSIPKAVCEKIVEQIPVGRLAEPEEIASAIAFLASEESAFITGINLPVNGGIHMI